MKLKPDDFPSVAAGEWVQPRRKYYLMGCCDCGLVHKMQFRLVPMRGGNKIQFRAWRNEPATRALRKRKKHGA